MRKQWERRMRRSAVTLGFGFGLCAAAPAYAASIETYVLDVAAQSGFPTYATPQPVFDFFGAAGVSLPANGLPLGGLPGTERLTTAASGSLSDSASASGSGNSTSGPWSASGTSSAASSFGQLGVEGDGTGTGGGDNNTVVGFEGFGLFTDSFSITSPSLAMGSAGFIRFHWTIAGSLSVTSGSDAAFVSMNYQRIGSPGFNLMNSNIQGGSPFFTPPSAGFTFASGTISGSDVFTTLPTSFVSGTSFDMKFGLFAAAMPGAGSTSVDWTADLTGISVFNGVGQPVADFTIASGSGTLYDASGAHPIPEPVPSIGAWGVLALTGLLWGIGLQATRRRYLDSANGS